jgi:hypothetical protein
MAETIPLDHTCQVFKLEVTGTVIRKNYKCTFAVVTGKPFSLFSLSSAAG